MKLVNNYDIIKVNSKSSYKDHKRNEKAFLWVCRIGLILFMAALFFGLLKDRGII